MDKKLFQDSLLNWYKTHHRILPWREDSSPYRVWISEIMLQQTRVEAVIPFFNRFIEALPTIQDLAMAEDDYLNKLWEGLGYYSRVRNIKKTAIKIITEYNGVFPSTYDEIISLPGIGPYTAGAILSIAFNQKYSAVDGNVLRVFSRILGIKTNIKDVSTKKMVKDSVDTLLPNQYISEFNQGLMEIGATVCIPNGSPKCEICPLSSLCYAYKNKLQNEIPLIIRNQVRREESKTVLILRFGDLYAIEKRPSTGLLANFYQFPLLDNSVSLNDIRKQYKKAIKLEDSTHLFSHIKWIMKGYLIDVDIMDSKYEWVSIDLLQTEYAIPSAFKVYKKHLGL